MLAFWYSKSTDSINFAQSETLPTCAAFQGAMVGASLLNLSEFLYLMNDIILVGPFSALSTGLLVMGVYST